MPEDFSTVCEIFQISPEKVILNIINKISFPLFYSNIRGTARWPTILFLALLDAEGSFDEKEMPFNEQFLNQISEAIESNLREGDTHENIQKAENETRKIMRKWHRDLLKERARYLIENLPKGGSN